VTVKRDGKLMTQTVARAMMEQQLGRKLSTDEQVDHINEDKTDDRLANLQVLTHRQNVRKHFGPRMWYRFACPQCGIEKVVPLADHKQSVRVGRRMYCSKRCSGLANH